MNTTDAPASASVANLADLAEGSMKMVKVDGHRVCLVRTASGVHAIDHACPHEGYGLTQGDLNGELLTCAWHNWKFRVSDGSCVQGEEGVTVHDVDVDHAGDVRVTINRPDPDVVRQRTKVSLRSGIERDYTGQVARDVVRLLQASENPGELIWEAVAYGAPRAEFGWGHSVASATDCLSMVDLYEGDHRALPIVQGIAGIAETGARSSRQRPARARPAPSTRRRPRFGPRSRPKTRSVPSRSCSPPSSGATVRPTFVRGSPTSSPTTCCPTGTARSTRTRRSSCST